MIMRSPKRFEPLPSEITPRERYFSRREIIAGLAGAGLAVGAGPASSAERLKYSKNARLSLSEAPNSYEDITTYNNFYEFGTGKAEPAERSGRFRTQPWSVTIAGEAEVTGTFSLEDILKPHALEERIYRLRCVEAWSMVIPWVGFSLAELIRQVEPQGSAKYVEFVTLADPKTMPGVTSNVLLWPYVEGLRMDEARHPLTMLAFGMYGEVLPNQNGAPVRLVVPWKYGFKSGKSLVKIRFVEKEPKTAWNIAAAQEYGFYSNVNPDVPHPRWSQATERRIGEEGGLLAKRRKTERFNGYETQVGSLYAGMDLKKFF